MSPCFYDTYAFIYRLDINNKRVNKQTNLYLHQAILLKYLTRPLITSYISAVVLCPGRIRADRNETTMAQRQPGETKILSGEAYRRQPTEMKPIGATVRLE